MQFKVEKRKHPNIPKHINSDFEIAKKFSEDLEKEIKTFIKSAVLFGSTARSEHPIYEPDIDVLLIIDDLTQILSPEVIQAYRIIVENTAAKHSKRLHITTLKLTSFWENVRNGDPLMITMLRDGIPLYDIGIFEPVQQLLFQGKIKPTKESIWTYFTRAPASIINADWHIVQATLDLYWAVIDSAHAALMKMGEIPPIPKMIPALLEKKFLRTGLLRRKHIQTMDFFYKLAKQIMHREKTKIKGSEFEKYKKRAKEFLEASRKIVEMP
jgi:uncharacterized protein (UPF0332 family)